MEHGGIDLVLDIKAIIIKDVIYLTARSYNKISSTMFIKYWQKAWPGIEKMVNNIANNNLLQTED